MSSVVGYLLRCAVILAGYCVACLAASAFIHLIVFAWAGIEPEDAQEVPALVLGSFVFSIPFVALFAAYFAFIPSAAVILVVEVLARRDWLFHALGGGVVAAIVVVFLRQGADSDFAAAGAGPMLCVVGSGIVGGFFYWLSAGRWAGTRPPAAPISPAP